MLTSLHRAYVAYIFRPLQAPPHCWFNNNPLHFATSMPFPSRSCLARRWICSQVALLPHRPEPASPPASQWRGGKEDEMLRRAGQRACSRSTAPAPARTYPTKSCRRSERHQPGDLLRGASGLRGPRGPDPFHSRSRCPSRSYLR